MVSNTYGKTAVRQAKKTARAGKEGRLNLRMDADLLAKMHAYARRHGTIVTDIVTRHFVFLLAAESSAHAEAEQL
jgi:hypothetical protein